MLDLESLEGTNILKRIKEVIKKGEEAALMYKLKPTTLKFNSNKIAYTASQLEYIKETNRDFLFRFGYVEHPQSQTGFYKYDDQSGEDLARWMSFKQINEASIKKVCGLDWHDTKNRQGYRVNEEGVFPLFEWQTIIRVQEPTLERAKEQLGFSEVLDYTIDQHSKPGSSAQ